MRAAMTKYHKLGGLETAGIYFSLLEAGKSKVTAPADPASGESPLPVRGWPSSPYLVEGGGSPLRLLLSGP